VRGARRARYRGSREVAAQIAPVWDPDHRALSSGSSAPKVVQLLYDADELFVKATELRGMEHINRSPLSLSTSQAAHALGVSLGTIRRWSDMGYLQSYRTPGGQRRFSQDQIEQFLGSLAQQTPDSAAERKVS
jgi:excisionase family DNA binding protein